VRRSTSAILGDLRAAAAPATPAGPGARSAQQRRVEQVSLVVLQQVQVGLTLTPATAVSRSGRSRLRNVSRLSFAFDPWFFFIRSSLAKDGCGWNLLLVGRAARGRAK
jgi:hypothetical protein